MAETIEVLQVETGNGIEFHAVGCQAATRRARLTRTATYDRAEFFAAKAACEAERKALNVPACEAETRYHACIGK